MLNLLFCYAIICIYLTDIQKCIWGRFGKILEGCARGLKKGLFNSRVKNAVSYLMCYLCNRLTNTCLSACTVSKSIIASTEIISHGVRATSIFANTKNHTSVVFAFINICNKQQMHGLKHLAVHLFEQRKIP